MPAPRNSYTFKEGLTMMAAKAVGIDPYMAAEAGENARATINAIRNAGKAKQPKDRAGYIREAQNELRTISATQHPNLVNALQTKLLALQGRGGDTAVAHVEPGEMVIPRSMLTTEVMRMIAAEAQRRGIDPRRLTVGGQGSINPATGAEEFGLFDWLSGGKKNELYMTGIDKPLKTGRRIERLPSPERSWCEYAEDTAQGAAPFWSERLLHNAVIREGYDNEVKKLGPNDNEGRSRLKTEWREVTPDPFKGSIKNLRPDTGARPSSVGRANFPNPKVTAAVRAGGGLGGALAVLSAKDAYDRISNAEDKTREAFGVVGGMAGGYIGGTGGAAGGAAISGGLASVPLAIGGSIAGSAIGEGVGYGLYDSYGQLRRNLSRRGP